MIKTTINLGTILKTQRESLHLSLEQAQHKIKINKKYLEMLENNFFNFNPSEVVVTNYIRAYAKFLKLHENATMDLYRRLPKSHKEENVELVQNKDINNNFSPTTLFLAALLLIGLFIS